VTLHERRGSDHHERRDRLFHLVAHAKGRGVDHHAHGSSDLARELTLKGLELGADPYARFEKVAHGLEYTTPAAGSRWIVLVGTTPAAGSRWIVLVETTPAGGLSRVILRLTSIVWAMFRCPNIAKGHREKKTPNLPFHLLCAYFSLLFTIILLTTRHKKK
jgi:hypothetical protein